MALYSLYDIVVNMKKLSNLLFVRHEGLEQKWWHRLAKVLIWGSTFILFTGVIIGFFIINRPFKVRSIEPAATSAIMPIACFHLSPVSIDQFSEEIKNQYPAYDYLDNNFLAKAVVKKFPECDKSVKLHSYVTQIIFGLLYVVAWFIFWESIIYRLIIYIIYGNRKHSNS